MCGDNRTFFSEQSFYEKKNIKKIWKGIFEEYLKLSLRIMSEATFISWVRRSSGNQTIPQFIFKFKKYFDSVLWSNGDLIEKFRYFWEFSQINKKRTIGPIFKKYYRTKMYFHQYLHVWRATQQFNFFFKNGNWTIAFYSTINDTASNKIESCECDII